MGKRFAEPLAAPDVVAESGRSNAQLTAAGLKLIWASMDIVAMIPRRWHAENTRCTDNRVSSVGARFSRIDSHVTLHFLVVVSFRGKL
jgi:hypothetical protein